jgi:hypothetical protein
LESSSKRATRSDTSPVRVRNSVPSAPIQSDRSTRSSSPYASPRSLTRKYSWIRPVRSARCTKVLFPITRLATMRPASRSVSAGPSAPSAFSPASQAANRSSAAAAEWVGS